MNVTKKIKMDLLAKQNIQTIHAVRDDTNSRRIQIDLFEGGVPWRIPEHAKIIIGYLAENGSSGVYDTLPNGEDAAEYDNTTITFALVPAALYPGTTKVTVVIADKDGNQISTFPVNVDVDENYSYGASDPETYINLGQWLSASISDLISGVRYDGPQELTDEQKTQARENIGACQLPLYVTIGTGGGVYIADATFEDIQAAHQQGRDVYCCATIVKMPLNGINATEAVFSADIGTTHYDARIKSDGTVNLSWYKYPKAEDLKQVTPQMFGAVGDGVVDDTEAFKNAITKCNAESMTLLVPAGTYNLTDILDFDGLTISGVDAEKCVLRMTAQATEREHFIKCYNKVSISNITFRQSYNGAILGMFGCNDAIVENCVVIVDEGIQNNGYFDLYQSNNNIRVVNCKFLNFSKQSAGGLWVRNCQNTVSENIIFEKCVMEHATNDEVFAVWGWVGTVQNVIFRDCTFMCMSETSSTHMMTLGMTGITKNVTLDHCFIKNNFATMYTIKSSAETETSVTENIRVNDCNIYVSGDGESAGLPVFGKNIIFTNCDIAVNREQYLSGGGNVFNNCRIELRNSLYARGPTTSNHCDIILHGPGLFAMSSATFKDCTIDFDNVKNNKFLFQPDGGELFRMDGCEWKNCPGFEAWMIFNELSDITVEFTNCKGVTGTVYCMAENFTLIAIGNTMNNFNTMVGDNTKHIYNNFIDGVFLPSGLPS